MTRKKVAGKAPATFGISSRLLPFLRLRRMSRARKSRGNGAWVFRARARGRRVPGPRALTTSWLLLAVLAGGLPAVGQAEAPEPGTLTRIANLPHYFWDKTPPEMLDGEGEDDLQRVLGETQLVTDPDNQLVFEFTEFSPMNSACRNPGSPWEYNIVAYDSDTYEFMRGACLDGLAGNDPSISDWSGGRNTRLSVAVARAGSPLVAVDALDRVMFFRAEGGTTSNDAVAVVSEDLLEVVGVWGLPDGGVPSVTDLSSDALPRIRGMSWHAPTNQLLVMTEFGDNQADHEPTAHQGVRVTSYDVATALASGPEVSSRMGNLADAILWSVAVPGCTSALAPQTFTVNPYRSVLESAVYVPCVLEQSHDSQREKAAVVRLELDEEGEPLLAPDGSPLAVAVVVPSGAGGFLFEAGSDRGFLPVETSIGTDLVVYDGKLADVLAQTQLEQSTTGYTIAIDEGTGRIYASSPLAHTLVDGRRTPLAPGTRFPLLTSGIPASPRVMNVLPPTEVHPYPRWILNDDEGEGELATLAHFQVLADTFPVTEDPPLSELDAGTYTGEIPKGARTETTYGGTARGFGFYSNLVGGFRGAVSNVLGTGNFSDRVPAGSRKLIGGYVNKLSLSSEDSSGGASALADPNQVTSSDFEGATGGGTGEGQLWPYPQAECAQPGPEEARIGTREGYYVTRWEEDEEGNPQPTQLAVPGSERHAQALVNCLDDQESAKGQAFYEGLGTRVEGFPAFSGSGESWAFIEPPPPGLGNAVISGARAYARNIVIDFGVDALSIGEVAHEATARATGRTDPGAEADRVVEVRNVAIGGQLLCEVNCSSQIFDHINREFAGRVKIIQPVPDPVWAVGSPGGFTAALQTHPTQRYGDIQFHGLSSEEAAILPGLRIILYNDGSQGLSRQIIDLAGVYVSANLGVELLPEPPPATVKIQLTDDSVPPNPLAAGTFKIYSDENGNGAIDELVDTLAVDALSGQAALCITGADGSGNCSFRLAPGNYVVHELNPPPGYSAAPDYPPEGETFAVDAGLEYIVKFVNLKALGGIEISLTDGSNPLEGGEFSVIGDEDRDGTADSSEKEVGNCKTDDQGECIFDEVLFGAYIVSQKKAPSGYSPSTAPISFAIDEPREIAKVDFVNLPAIGLIKVTLKDDSPEAKPLAGGVFDIYADNGDRSLGSADEKIATCTTDLGGRCALKSSEVASRPGFWVAPDCPGEALDVLKCAKNARSGPPPEGPSLVSPFGTYLVHQQSAPGELMKSEDDVAFALAEPGQVAQVDFVNGLKGASGTVGLSRPGRSATQGVSYEIEEVPPPSVTSEEAPSNEGPNTILRILRLPAEGLQLLVRDPGQAAVVGAVLSLLLLPLLVSRRRRLWLQITTQT